MEINKNHPASSYTPDQIAEKLMIDLLHYNGAVDRFHPAPKFEELPEDHVKAIGNAAYGFFTINHTVWTEDDLLNILDGEEGENEQMYGALTFWDKLSEALNDYFNNGM